MYWVWLPSSVSIQGAKEDPALQKEPKFLSKAGWLKKGYGRLLASYKDRYIQVEKTEIVVYENEVYKVSIHRVWEYELISILPFNSCSLAAVNFYLTSDNQVDGLISLLLVDKIISQNDVGFILKLYTQIFKYQSFVLQDLQNCLERLDLENYDKCHELKSPFTKKQRLILIRSAKSTNKVREESVSLSLSVPVTNICPACTKNTL